MATVPSTTIAAANKVVSKITSESKATPKKKPRGEYAKFMPQFKAGIGKRAAEHGVVSTLRHYVRDHPTLKESTVRTWKNV